MRDPIVSSKYTEALLSVAKKQGKIDVIAEEIRQLIPIFTAREGILRFLEAPQITDEDKYAVVKKIFETKLTQLLYQFINIVLRKHRINLINEIFKEYLKMVDIEHGIQEASVITAITLDSGTIERLRKKLEEITHKSIRLHSKVEPKILGGVIVQIDNTLIDGSFQSKLADLKESLMSVKVY